MLSVHDPDKFEKSAVKPTRSFMFFSHSLISSGDSKTRTSSGWKWKIAGFASLFIWFLSLLWVNGQMPEIFLDERQS